MKIYLILATALCSSLIYSCKDKEPPIIPNEEELITTLSYTLTNDSTGDSKVFNFSDLDGDGGNSPVINVEDLAANSSYTGQISLLNESETPAENVLEEVLEEDEDHQFFYNSDITDLSVSYTDFDGNGNPIGASTKLTTADAANGDLTIILRHQPDKSGSGVSDGDITNAGGESDIEVTFSISIQ